MLPIPQRDQSSFKMLLGLMQTSSFVPSSMERWAMKYEIDLVALREQMKNEPESVMSKLRRLGMI